MNGKKLKEELSVYEKICLTQNEIILETKKIIDAQNVLQEKEAMLNCHLDTLDEIRRKKKK